MQSFLRILATIALFTLTVGLVSCSKNQNTTITPTDPFTQKEADDVMVQIGEMMALDNSGWLKEIAATVEGTDGLDPPETNPESGGTGTPPWATLRDTSFIENGMTYTFNYNYVARDPVTGELQDHFNWVPGVFSVEGIIGAFGDVMSPEFSGSYRHIGDIEADFLDVPGMIEFDGFSEDTSLALVTSAFRADTSYWFMDNFFSYEDVRMDRNFAANPYPISGFVDMDDVDAFRLNGTDITDFNNHVEADVMISFNGTVNARATIQDDFDPPSGVYMYDVNLQTGAITRVVTVP